MPGHGGVCSNISWAKQVAALKVIMCNSFFQLKSISCFKQRFESQPKKSLA